MNNKFKIIETEDYTLAVSDEDIKESNCGLITSVVMTYEQMIKEWGEPLGRKIIAYQPKNNAPTLNLPLLPQMVVESEVEKLAKIATSKLAYSGPTASTKVYSEEDLRKAINMARVKDWQKDSNGDNFWEYSRDEIIQSLKQPKPKYFIAETENKLVLNLGIDVYDPNTHVVSNELKTTTIDGKTYCVGCYLCD